MLPPYKYYWEIKPEHEKSHVVMIHVKTQVGNVLYAGNVIGKEIYRDLDLYYRRCQAGNNCFRITYKQFNDFRNHGTVPTNLHLKG